MGGQGEGIALTALQQAAVRCSAGHGWPLSILGSHFWARPTCHVLIPSLRDFFVPGFGEAPALRGCPAVSHSGQGNSQLSGNRREQRGRGTPEHSQRPWKLTFPTPASFSVLIVARLCRELTCPRELSVAAGGALSTLEGKRTTLGPTRAKWVRGRGTASGSQGEEIPMGGGWWPGSTWSPQEMVGM